MPVLEARIGSSRRVLLRTLDEQQAVDTPVLAIHWFDTRSAWLYHLYNVLAVRSVVNVGGRAIFKGRVGETLLGDDPQRRDMLLLVRYPALTRFRDMLRDHYFQVVSLLRVAAVSRFTFGFAGEDAAGAGLSLARQAWRKESPDGYAIDHFRGPPSSLEEATALAAGSPVEVAVHGSVTVHLEVESGSPAKATRVPCLMEHFVLFRAPGEAVMREWIGSTRCRDALGRQQNGFVALVERTL